MNKKIIFFPDDRKADVRAEWGKTSKKGLKVIDLFAGCGGLSAGIEMAGCEVVAALDFDLKACMTYRKNFTHPIIEGDITKDETKQRLYDAVGSQETDVVCAGFPCQSFSMAGLRLIDDPRNFLYREFVNIVDYFRPKYIVGENVKGFMTKQGGIYPEQLKEDFAKMGTYAVVFTRSFKLAIIATIICLLIGYPVSYIMSKEGPRFQRIAMVLIMLPMWMNFLLRTYSWMSILENNGLLNQLFQKIGLIALYNNIFGTDIQFFRMINTQGAVVLGMVYNYLPFMILPIYSVIVKMDNSLIEAARDLGANTFNVFRRVILPLSLPGVLSGITMVFVPSVSTFAISKMLGGGTELLLGDLIEQQFLGGAYNPQLGAAISLVMMIIVVICMVVMNRFGEGEEQAVMM